MGAGVEMEKGRGDGVRVYQTRRCQVNASVR